MGSKESIVNVTNVIEVGEDDLELISESRGSVNYSFPFSENIRLLKELTAKWVFEVYIDPFKIEAYNESDNPVTNYIAGKKLLPYLVPLRVTSSDPEYVIEISKNLAMYRYKDEVILGWR